MKKTRGDIRSIMITGSIWVIDNEYVSGMCPTQKLCGLSLHAKSVSCYIICSALCSSEWMHLSWFKHLPRSRALVAPVLQEHDTNVSNGRCCLDLNALLRLITVLSKGIKYNQSRWKMTNLISDGHEALCWLIHKCNTESANETDLVAL